MKQYLLLLMVLFGSWLTAAQEVSIDVRIPDVIEAGQQFRVEITANTLKAKSVELSTPDGLMLLAGPFTATSKSLQIINGKRSQTEQKTFSFTYKAMEPGEYTLPAAKVMVGSAVYRTKPKTFKVYDSAVVRGQQGAAPGASDGGAHRSAASSVARTFVRVITSKSSVYVQEPLQVSIKLYSTTPNIGLEGIKFPEFDGFVKRDLNHDSVIQLETEEYEGSLYYTALLSNFVVFPQKAGTLTVPAGSFDLSVTEPVSDFVTDAFGFPIGPTHAISHRTVRSAPLALRVLSLPEPQPEGFQGAVGHYTLTQQISDAPPRSNDSFDITLRIEGEGNLSLVPFPELTLPDGFELYDPQEEDEIRVTPSGETGWKSKQLITIPRFHGEFELPALRLIYFDPTTASYHTAEVPSRTIEVAKGSAADAAPVTTYTKEEVRVLDTDIHYLKPLHLSDLSRSSISYFTYLLSYLILVGITIALYYILWRRSVGDVETVETRAKHAGSVAKRYLKLAVKRRSSGDSKAYFEALLRGLNNFLSAKLHLSTSTLTKENISTALQSKGYVPEYIDQTLSILSDLEMVRYTPSSDQMQLDEYYQRAAEVIDNFQRNKSKK